MDMEVEVTPLGKLVREYRERAKLSQEQLAERLRISHVALGKIERGETKRPGKKILQGLEDVLGISRSDAQTLIDGLPLDREDPMTIFQRLAAIPDDEERNREYEKLPVSLRRAVEDVMFARMRTLMQQQAALSEQSNDHDM